jgi:hypothetical protein
MPSKIHGVNGKEKLIQKYKQDFRTENQSYYSGEDYVRAERGYVQYRLKFGGSGGDAFTAASNPGDIA